MDIFVANNLSNITGQTLQQQQQQKILFNQQQQKKDNRFSHRSVMYSSRQKSKDDKAMLVFVDNQISWWWNLIRKTTMVQCCYYLFFFSFYHCLLFHLHSKSNVSIEMRYTRLQTYWRKKNWVVISLTVNLLMMTDRENKFDPKGNFFYSILDSHGFNISSSS